MKECGFCGGSMHFIYNMNGYEIVQCDKCLTSVVSNMPDDIEIQKFYSGFLFCANVNNKQIFENTIFKDWFGSFKLGSKARMLDVGGGGGFFSYAFEYFNMGESYYIDIDDKACKFAAKELNLKNVINDDVRNLKNITSLKFDFIYARHLIEHLKYPLEFIDSCIELLTSSGVLVIQFPNGISLEYLGYPKLLKGRINTIRKSNKEFTKLKTILTICSKKIAHGIDPIRHLWAITPEGISKYLKRKDIDFQIQTAPLTDPVFSPYYRAIGNFEKTRSGIVNNTLVKINGGTHLIVIIKKKSDKQVLKDLQRMI